MIPCFAEVGLNRPINNICVFFRHKTSVDLLMIRVWRRVSNDIKVQDENIKRNGKSIN